MISLAGTLLLAASLSLLEVPYISQSEALCGGAAAAMVLRYWGAPGVAAEDFAALVDRSNGGIETAALARAVRERGYDALPASGTVALVQRELTRGRPVIALIEDRPGAFHYVVV
ncbi:MAG: C39 family peptidase, partial [Steroidobacteraceae bacterium]